MSAFHDNALIGASGSQGYQISRSVRLRSSASAYFNRTPASAGSLTTWTWSAWVKRGALGSNNALFGVSNNSDKIWFSSDQLSFYIGAGAAYTWWSAALFRDPSAWYHIVVVLDTTNATSTDRVRVFVNGVRATAGGSTTYPTLNYSGCNFNTAVSTNIGRGDNTNNYYYDGYLTEINFIDGQALAPTSFGETNAVTGVWQPKKYTGTYGTNGFYLNFSDNSSNTATTIGKDYSGNGNNWTPNNISVTAGATYDSMLDVPTQWADGGNGRGNYATLNPLILNAVASMGVAGGNLNITRSSAGWASLSSTIRISSGKWYWEVLPTNNSTSQMHGIQTIEALGQYPGQVATSWGYYTSNGQKYNNGTGAAYGSAYSPSNPIGVALDMDNGRIWFSRNGVWEASGDPAAGTNAAFTGITGEVVPAFGLDAASTAASVNFGQRPFAYTPPTGFKALNTLNLPTPTILKGNQYFDVSTWTGNGTSQSIVNSGAMQPDLVWAKQRSSTQWHRLIDAVRGSNRVLYSNDTSAEFTDSTQLTAFNSNGFSVGSEAGWNANAATYVGWQWKEGATQGFDIVTFTKSSSAQTVNHSLGVTPAMMIVKGRGPSTSNWLVYHKNANASPQNGGVALEQTSAFSANAGYWNNTSPTSTQFTVGSFMPNENSVAYLFAEVAGFSKAFSYTGNGSADGPFIFCGFRPRFVMTKRTDTTGPWQILDTARDTYNSAVAALFPNTSGAEASFTQPNGIDYLSNGFKLRNSSTDDNASGGTYIGMAFAEVPYKFALGR